jgi:ATP-dependent DNA helicase RecG
LIEAYGTGVPKIMRNYEKCATKPQIVATDNAFKITLPNTNEVSEKVLMNESEYAVMDLCKDKGFIVRKDIEVTLSISQAMAVRLLKGLLNKGQIRTVGSGKNTRYMLNK